MEAIIETFHIDLKLLIAQAINFAIVFFVLYFFALKPLFKIMAERTGKIEKSLEDAQKIEKRIIEIENDYDAALSKAKKEAALIMEKAGSLGEKKKTEMVAKAKEEIGQIINQEKAKMQSEKSKVLKEIRKEMADLIVASLEKILEEKVDLKKDKEIINKILNKR
jgi:F-type H+-transporting ATPase subunit b